MPDNGIKFFARGGTKLPDDVEDAIEARDGRAVDAARPVRRSAGSRTTRRRRSTAYVDHLVAVAPHRLDGLQVVVDCAHGAASYVAPEALRRAGREVVAIGAEPDGLQHQRRLSARRTSTALAARGASSTAPTPASPTTATPTAAWRSTRDGEIVDGDQILAICALALRETARLAGDTVVATVMTNLGFKLAMAEHGIAVVETAVGDRYVLEAMRARGIRARRRAVRARHLRSTTRRPATASLTALHAAGADGADRARRSPSSRR